VRSARFSRPVACRHAPPSELVVPARLERATPAVGKRCSAPLSYGTEWSGWLDSNQRPPASEAGTLAGLSYTLLALRREIESLSPDRQSGRLTRCVTEREYGASGPTRTATECALNALPLPIGVQTRDSLQLEELQLEDQAGFEPAVSFRCRLKRPARSTATVTGPGFRNGGPAWLRSTCRRLKRPLPLHSGLRLRVRLVLPPGAAPGSLAYRASALLLS
jgi:hypothetical protein